MGWFVLASLTALAESFKALFSKRGLAHIDEYVAGWALRFVAFLFLLPVAVVLPIPELNWAYVGALAASGILNVGTTLLYMKALKESDLSLSVPMITFTPLFLLATSPLILGEFPNRWGVFGVLLIVAGSYTMQIQSSSKSIWAPFKALWMQKGPRYMLGAALLWSFTANIDKIGVQNSSPLFWALSITGAIALLLTPIALWHSDGPISQVKPGWTHMLLIGLFSAITLGFQMAALKLTLVAYVISIKRVSVVLAVLWGTLFLGESHLRQRLAGAVIMVFGVACITLS